MADISFPDIPYAPVYSYGEDPEDPGITSPMEDGSVISRGRFTKSRLTFRLPGWKMNGAHKAILLNFYRNIAKGSANRFNWTHPDPDSEFYGQAFEVRFASPPKFQKYLPGWWTVEIVLQEA